MEKRPKKPVAPKPSETEQTNEELAHELEKAKARIEALQKEVELELRVQAVLVAAKIVDDSIIDETRFYICANT